MADRIPAAQYLRMSTEHQQYSFENQSATIRRYAQEHEFEVVKSYEDFAKTGLLIRNRSGLRQMLQDVINRDAAFKAILVLDVTRWGRFQDIDESAHYEFLCKSAGVPIHYCAEGFNADSPVQNSILKAIKRVMAAEYSRELGVKVLAGQKRSAELGFKQGGQPGLGYRRMLLSQDGSRKLLLSDGERKGLTTDQVILVPGPIGEIEEIRNIFRRFVSEESTLRGIARDLNQRGVPSSKNARWTHSVVGRLLSNPKYVGDNVFNRTTSKLRTQSRKLPVSEWVVKRDAHEGIVDRQTFDAVQRRLDMPRLSRSNQEILVDLRSVLARRGELGSKIIDQEGIVCGATVAQRFGSLRRAYELIGYKPVYHPRQKRQSR